MAAIVIGGCLLSVILQPSSADKGRTRLVTVESLSRSINAEDNGGALVRELGLVGETSRMTAAAIAPSEGSQWVVTDLDSSPDRFVARISHLGSRREYVLTFEVAGPRGHRVLTARPIGARSESDALDEEVVDYRAFSFVETDGSCSLSASASSNSAAAGDYIPLASVVKVILGAISVDRIEAGSLGLGDILVIDRGNLSLRSGDWADLPLGARRTVAEALQAMLNSSDNTAFDALLQHLGAESVRHDAVAAYGYRPDWPFFSSGELFRLKFGDGAAMEAFLDGLSLKERLEQLERLVSSPLPILTGGELPANPSELGWLATPEGVCRASARLAGADVLNFATYSMNIGSEGWRGKTGNEPGLLTLALWRETQCQMGPRFGINILAAWNPELALDSAIAHAALAKIRELSDLSVGCAESE